MAQQTEVKILLTLDPTLLDRLDRVIDLKRDLGVRTPSRMEAIRDAIASAIKNDVETYGLDLDPIHT